MALSSVPWVFLYRDTVEIMQSHMKGMKSTRKSLPVCARNFGRSAKLQPPTTLQVINDKGRSVNDLTKVEYCAAHLAGLSLSAIQEHDRTTRGRFVSYAQMPEIVWDDILPNHFNVDLPRKGVANMKETALVYSKGRGSKANQKWEEDSTKKLETATPEVIRAADKFVGDIYNRMKELSS